MHKATKDVGKGIAHLDDHKQINQVDNFSSKSKMHICSRLDCFRLHIRKINCKANSCQMVPTLFQDHYIYDFWNEEFIFRGTDRKNSHVVTTSFNVQGI